MGAVHGYPLLPPRLSQDHSALLLASVAASPHLPGGVSCKGCSTAEQISLEGFELPTADLEVLLGELLLNRLAGSKESRRQKAASK